MCGIALVVHRDGRTPEPGVIRRMIHALRHRGPDDEDIHLAPGVALGHTRLSIVDIEHGAQPMSSADGRFVIVFNGEIYNFKALRRALKDKGCVFSTRSDTEVVLQLFRMEGPAALERLHGMFAFCILDKRSGELFLARDRLGIKPLFYAQRGENFLAASEMKALFASGLVVAQLDAGSVFNYFRYQFAVPPHTPFAGVRELPAGHYMSLRPGHDPQIRRYWDLDFAGEGEYESTDEAYWARRFEEGLAEAAASHTIGEVPIASYLSGGIDSGAVTALLNEQSPMPLQTFSIGFADSCLDESESFRRVATDLGVEADELRLPELGPPDPVSLLRECLYHLEQPQRMAVDLPHFLLSGRVREHGYKVVYTGDGADEILAGYDCYRQDAMRVSCNTPWGRVARRWRYLNRYTEYFAPDHMRMLLGLHARKAQRKTIERFGFYPAWYDFWQINHGAAEALFDRDRFGEDVGADQMQALAERIKTRVSGLHPLNQSLYMETHTRLPGWILWKSDRLSMAHGVEARVPFLDHTLVELAARMPPAMKLRGMNEKYVLKKVMAPRLPRFSHEFKKRGFYTPIREWFFRESRREALAPYLSYEVLREAGIFDAARVTALFERLLGAGAPANMNEQYALMRMEWSLMTVLSTQMLHVLFVRANLAQSFEPSCDQTLQAVS